MKRNNNLHTYGLCLISFAALSSCEGSPGPTDVEYDPVSIRLTPAALRLGALGDTVRLAAYLQTRSERAASSARVDWRSSEPEIVSVTPGGLVRALGPGEATITASAASASATTEVVVIQSVASVSVSPASVVLTGLSDTTRLRAIAQDAGGSSIDGPRLFWSSEDTSVATVDGRGLVTAVADGKTRISASGVDVTGERISTTASVLVAVASKIEVAPNAVNLYGLGHTAQLRATVYGLSGDSLERGPAIWMSSDVAVAAVNAAGVVTAVSPGRARIRVSSGPVMVSVPVRVAPRTLLVDSDSVHLPWPLLTHAFNVAVRDEITGELVADPEPVHFTSSDSTIATVDSAGVVTAIREGVVEIVASSAGVEGKATVSVADPDRAALVAFFNATGGENWDRNDNWLTDQPIWQPPGWYGVVPVLGAGEMLTDSRLRKLLAGGGADPDSTSMNLRATMSEAWTSWSATAPISQSELRTAAENNIAASRVFNLVLPWNGLSGTLSNTNVPFDSLTFLNGLELAGNELSGELSARLDLNRSLRLLDLADNSFSETIPEPLLASQNLVYVDLTNNNLSGNVQGFLPNLLVLLLAHNELTGTIPDIDALAPQLGIATWYDNKGICVEQYLSRVERLLLAGPRCDDELTGPGSIFLSPRHLRFSSIGDSSKVRVMVIDGNGWRLDPARYPAVLAGNGEIVSIGAASPGEYWLKANDNGIDSLYARRERRFGLPPSVSEPLVVTVEQVAVTADAESEIELEVGEGGEWMPVFRDRNGKALDKDVILSVHDPAVVETYGGRFLHARQPGQTFVAATLPGAVGPRPVAEVRVKERQNSLGPRITSWDPEVLLPGAPLVISGERLDGSVSVSIDGVPTKITRRAPGEVGVVVPGTEDCVPRGYAVISARGRRNFGDIASARIENPGEDIEDVRTVGEEPLQLGSDVKWCIQSGNGNQTEHLVLLQGVVGSGPPPPSVGSLRSIRGGPLAGEFIIESNMRTANIEPSSKLNEDTSPSRAAVDLGRIVMEEPRGKIERDSVLARHRKARTKVRQGVLENIAQMAGVAPVAASRSTGQPLSRGDTLSFNYNLGQCEGGTPGRGVVKVAGQHVLIVSDLENGDDYSDDVYENFGMLADEMILPTLFQYLGSAPDVNADGRVAMVFTEHVNRTGAGILGWVAPTNLLSREICPASNEMEVFFGRVPERGWLTAEVLEPLLPGLVAHETAHVIQGRRFLNQKQIVDFGADVWLMEGQADLAKEVVGHAVTGRSPGQNYGASVAFGNDDGSSWYQRNFEDFISYFRGPGAPAACGWWTEDSGPCGGRPLWYGISWSFLRWVMDQYGPTVSGGESAINTAILDAPPEGSEFAKIEEIVGEDFNTLLAGWGAALFLDDRFAAGSMPDSYGFTSWNFRQIFDHMGIEVPVHVVPFDEFTIDSSRLRVGSTMYFRVLGAPDSATVGALEVRGEFSRALGDAGRSWYGLQAIVVPLQNP